VPSAQQQARTRCLMRCSAGSGERAARSAVNYVRYIYAMCIPELRHALCTLLIIATACNAIKYSFARLLCWQKLQHTHCIVCSHFTHCRHRCSC
jgi:hypothetical protein